MNRIPDWLIVLGMFLMVLASPVIAAALIVGWGVNVIARCWWEIFAAPGKLTAPANFKCIVDGGDPCPNVCMRQGFCTWLPPKEEA